MDTGPACVASEVRRTRKERARGCPALSSASGAYVAAADLTVGLWAIKATAPSGCCARQCTRASRSGPWPPSQKCPRMVGLGSAPRRRCTGLRAQIRGRHLAGAPLMCSSCVRVGQGACRVWRIRSEACTRAGGGGGRWREAGSTGADRGRACSGVQRRTEIVRTLETGAAVPERGIALEGRGCALRRGGPAVGYAASPPRRGGQAGAGLTPAVGAPAVVSTWRAAWTRAMGPQWPGMGVGGQPPSQCATGDAV